MRVIFPTLSTILGFLFLISFSIPQTSCSKTTTKTVTDTTIIRDTTVIQDTTVVHDTVYNCLKGLVAFYNFNNGSLKDLSGFGNDIAFNNATPTTDRYGNANGAYLFNGTSSYMTVPNSYSISNFDSITMYAVVKINGFYQGSCSFNQILSKGYPYDVNGFYELDFADPLVADCGTPDLSTESFGGVFGDNAPQGTGANAYSTSTFVSTGQWYYVAYTYDGVTAKLYMNGQLIDNRPKTITFTPNTFDLWIGEHQNPSFPYFLNGVIDEIRIYNRPLSQGDINHLMTLQNGVDY